MLSPAGIHLKVPSFDPSNGWETTNGAKTELCIQRTDYLQTKPFTVHGDPEVAEVDGVVGLDPLAARGGGGGVGAGDAHLLGVAHVWHLVRY